MTAYRVGIVDDHRPYALALADSLTSERDVVVVGIAGNGEEALRLATTQRPDVLLMDLEMPVMDGIAATRRLTEQMPSVEVLVLTVFDDGPHLFQALQAGAKGYLLKNAEPSAVAQAVRDVVAGGAALPPALAGLVLAEFGRLSQSSTGREALYRQLTRQETEVLKRLSRRLTNEQISQELCLEMTTVKKHVGNVLRKLEVNNRQEAAQIARTMGL